MYKIMAMDEKKRIERLIEGVRRQLRHFNIPYVTEVSEKTKDPFRVLVSCLLSLRTKDEVTAAASKRLFEHATTPKELCKLPVETIERLIYPVGFYRVKARTLKAICKELTERYGSQVPHSVDELVRLKGVGRKTATLVVSMGYGVPAICVDTHVHRITNRWGIVSTKSAHQTEFALYKVVPKRHWIELNTLLVAFGQNVCKPLSPHCSTCGIKNYCRRVGVERSR